MDHVRPKSGQVQVEHGGEGVVHIRYRGGGWTVYIWGAMVWFPSDDNAGLGSRQVGRRAVVDVEHGARAWFTPGTEAGAWMSVEGVVYVRLKAGHGARLGKGGRGSH